MSISVRSVRRVIAGAVGSAGVAGAVLFGAAPPAQAASPPVTAVAEAVDTAVAGPVLLENRPDVTGVVPLSFQTAPTPDWWGHHWGHHGWGHGWRHWWHPWWWW